MIYATHHIPDNMQRLIELRACGQCGVESGTQADLARKLEVSSTFVKKLLTGDKTPSVARLLEIARFFGVTPNELLGAGE
jgi:DNA-binding XRE family transcriptional regulator